MGGGGCNVYLLHYLSSYMCFCLVSAEEIFTTLKCFVLSLGNCCVGMTLKSKRSVIRGFCLWKPCTRNSNRCGRVQALCGNSGMFWLGSHICHRCKPVWKQAFRSCTVISPARPWKTGEEDRSSGGPARAAEQEPQNTEMPLPLFPLNLWTETWSFNFAFL